MDEVEGLCRWAKKETKQKNKKTKKQKNKKTKKKQKKIKKNQKIGQPHFTHIVTIIFMTIIRKKKLSIAQQVNGCGL